VQHASSEGRGGAVAKGRGVANQDELDERYESLAKEKEKADNVSRRSPSESENKGLNRRKNVPR